MNAEDRGKVVLPARLLPYLDDLVATGLHGTTIEAVVVSLVEEIVRTKVAEGILRSRRHGKRSSS